MKVGVIIPTLNEESELLECLRSILCDPLFEGEIIVSDGGSKDNTVFVARDFGAQVILCAPAGLARQCNEAASRVEGDVLLFLSADCRLSKGWFQSVLRLLTSPYVVAGGFKLEIDAHGVMFRVLSFGGNFRSHYRNLVFPDQGFFVKKHSFFKIGGFCEDSLIPFASHCLGLLREGEVILLPEKVLSSARKWKQKGLFPTTFSHIQTFHRFLAKGRS